MIKFMMSALIVFIFFYSILSRIREFENWEWWRGEMEMIEWMRHLTHCWVGYYSHPKTSFHLPVLTHSATLPGSFIQSSRKYHWKIFWKSMFVRFDYFDILNSTRNHFVCITIIHYMVIILATFVRLLNFIAVSIILWIVCTYIYMFAHIEK